MVDAGRLYIKLCSFNIHSQCERVKEYTDEFRYKKCQNTALPEYFACGNMYLAHWVDLSCLAMLLGTEAFKILV